MIDIEDIHDKETLDRYWAENGGPPKSVAQQKAVAEAERAVIDAALSSIGPLCPYIELNHAVARLVMVSRAEWRP